MTRTSAIRSPTAASTSSTCGSTTVRRTATSDTSSTSSATSKCRGNLKLNTRIQARGAQPITPSPRILERVDRGRNSARKDNEFFTFDWRARPPVPHRAFEITAMLEMFNTFNNANNINPLSTPGALQLRRIPANRRRRSAAGAVGGEGRILNPLATATSAWRARWCRPPRSRRRGSYTSPARRRSARPARHRPADCRSPPRRWWSGDWGSHRTR